MTYASKMYIRQDLMSICNKLRRVRYKVVVKEGVCGKQLDHSQSGEGTQTHTCEEKELMQREIFPLCTWLFILTKAKETVVE